MFLEALTKGGVEGLLGSIGPLAKDLREAITGEPSAEKKAEFQQKLMEFEYLVGKAQTDINLEEAKNTNLFVAGWRPFIGWVCGVGLLYATMLQPAMTWWAKLYHPEFTAPGFDTATLMTTLATLLGLGGLRTFEKFKDVENKR